MHPIQTPRCAQALELESDEKVNWRLPPGKLSPIHFRAVQRIYGAAPGAPTRRLPGPPCTACLQLHDN